MQTAPKAGVNFSKRQCSECGKGYIPRRPSATPTCDPCLVKAGNAPKMVSGADTRPPKGKHARKGNIKTPKNRPVGNANDRNANPGVGQNEPSRDVEKPPPAKSGEAKAS